MQFDANGDVNSSSSSSSGNSSNKGGEYHLRKVEKFTSGKYV